MAGTYAGSVADRLLVAVRHARANGVTADEVADALGLSRALCATRLSRLQRHGLAHGRKLPKRKTRFFRSADLADQWRAAELAAEPVKVPRPRAAVRPVAPKPPSVRKPTRRDELVALAKRPGGVSPGEAEKLCGGSPRSVPAELMRLAELGRIQRGRAGRSTRYFGCAAEALRWAQSMVQAAPASVVVRPHRPDPSAEVVVPAHVRVQRGPSPVDTRYCVAPGERVSGAGFAARGIGRYDGDAPAWVRAAVGVR